MRLGWRLLAVGSGQGNINCLEYRVMNRENYGQGSQWKKVRNKDENKGFIGLLSNSNLVSIIIIIIIIYL